MDWDDYGPTIEDEIRWNDELNPVEKKLLIQESRIEFYRAALILALLFLLLGAIGVIVRGWLLAVIDGAIFWGTAIAYALLEDKKKRASMLIPVLLFLLLGAIGIISRGWPLVVTDGAIVCGTAIAYKLLEDKKKRVEAALAEESRNRQKIESRNKKRR